MMGEPGANREVLGHQRQGLRIEVPPRFPSGGGDGAADLARSDVLDPVIERVGDSLDVARDQQVTTKHDRRVGDDAPAPEPDERAEYLHLARRVDDSEPEPARFVADVDVELLDVCELDPVELPSAESLEVGELLLQIGGGRLLGAEELDALRDDEDAQRRRASAG